MGFPFFVSLTDDARPLIQPPENEENLLYVKQVVIQETKPCFASYKRIKNSLIINHLISSRGFAVLRQLMLVKFHSNNKNFIIDILKKGIECNGAQYHYLGQSHTQLRNKTCFMMDASICEIYSLLAEFGNFEEIFPVARRVQKIAPLFLPFSHSLELKPDEFDVIDDVVSTLGTYVFTDGCGLMSPEFAREVQEMHNLSYVPSVVEVRSKHYSGLLVRYDEMPSLRVKVLFRNSMADLDTPLEDVSEVTSVGIVSFSRPYSLGYMDTLTVMLLAETGVPFEYLERTQADYHKMLQRLEDKTYAGYFLRITGNDNLLQAFQKDGLTSDILKKLQSMKIKEIRMIKSEKVANDYEESEDNGQFKLMNDDEVDESDLKATTTNAPNENQSSSSRNNYEDVQVDQDFDVRIFTPDARVVYGVSDPYSQLKYGECFFQPTLHNTESNAFEMSEVVFVMRRPSFHAGDVRVLKLTHGKEAYKDLFDCIVFPSRGYRPHANECAGGRVGGDKYFVCWDLGLIPRYISSPYVSLASALTTKIANKMKEFAPSLKCLKKKPESEAEKRRRQQLTRNDVMEYFGNFKDQEASRTRATSLFIKYASLFGSTCSECELLKKMLAKEFDWNERYEQTVMKVTDLEEAHSKELKALAKLSLSAQLSSMPVRPTGFWDHVLISLQWKKEAFCPGNDAWNKIKARNAEFTYNVAND